MKKLLLLTVMLLGLTVSAQTDFFTVLPSAGDATSVNGRAPQGGAMQNRSVWLITAAEMSAAGFVSGSVINSLGFNYTTAQNVPTTSTTYNVYLQNTADATNLKSTTWATAINGMTLVSNANITVPAAIGTVDFPFSGGSPFTYTGGAIYVAFDYQNTGTIATVNNISSCTTTLAGGLKGAWNSAATPVITTITASNWRPETRFGKPVTCLKPINLVSSNLTNSSVTISWTAPTPAPAGGYEYYFATVNTPPTAGTMPSGSTIAGITTVDLSGLPATTDHFFWVRSVCGAADKSDWSARFTFNTTLLPGCSTVVAPANLATGVTVNLSNNTTTPTTRETSVALSWTAPTTGGAVTGYNIYWGTTLANMVKLNATPFTGTAVNITGILYNTTYFWSAVPLNAGGEAASCNPTSFTTMVAPAFCLNGSLYPTATYTPTTCDGFTENIVNTDAFAGHYANIAVTAGETYQFESSVATDKLTISANAGLNAVAQGVTPLVWTATATGTVRFYINGQNCNNIAVNRTRTIFCGASLSTPSFSASTISTYPNPVKDVLTVKLDSNIDNITVSNILGQEVISKTVNHIETKIDMSKLSSGTYIIKVNSNDQIKTSKIIKE